MKNALSDTLLLSLSVLLLSTSAACTQIEVKNNIFFNGEDLTGWFAAEEGGFRLEDGTLITDGFGRGSDLFTDRSYCNYILSFEYMISEVGNSGVLIRTDPENPRNTGFEIQLLAPWTPRRDDLHCTASIYGHVPVTSRPDETPEQWHTMEISVDRKDIVVSVDGEVRTRANMDAVESLRGKNLCGAIGFQVDHAEVEGQWVKWRNIQLRDLNLEAAFVLRGFKDTDERIRKAAHASAVNTGISIIDSLAVYMAGDDPVSSSGARQALFDITARISAPDADPAEKTALRTTLMSAGAAIQDVTTSTYLSWLAGMLDGTE